jgi:DNA mismatch endonuclease (patch repair protein)
MPDDLTPQQRSYAMSRVKGRDTGLEHTIRAELEKRGYKFEIYRKDLPGKPDIVFPDKKVVVFIDGDFWHGYRFPSWKNTQSLFWQEKIGKTRLRDKRNFRKLRLMGWTVIRIWQHEVKKKLEKSIDRIIAALTVNKNIGEEASTRSGAG